MIIGIHKILKILMSNKEEKISGHSKNKPTRRDFRKTKRHNLNDEQASPGVHGAIGNRISAGDFYRGFLSAEHIHWVPTQPYRHYRFG